MITAKDEWIPGDVDFFHPWEIRRQTGAGFTFGCPGLH